MWGKLTERSDRTLTKLITVPHNLYRFLASPGVEVTNLAFSSDDVVWLSWKLSAEEKVPNPHYTNEVFGAYVIAGARIHLYSFLDSCKRTQSIATQIRLYLFSRVGKFGRSTQGTSWGTCNPKCIPQN